MIGESCSEDMRVMEADWPRLNLSLSNEGNQKAMEESSGRFNRFAFPGGLSDYRGISPAL